MIEIATAHEIRESICLKALEELGFVTADQRFSLNAVVEATVGIIDFTVDEDISALVVAGGIPTDNIYATEAWMEWSPRSVWVQTAALAVIAHLGELIK
jgi:hypothetical protein